MIIRGHLRLFKKAFYWFRIGQKRGKVSLSYGRRVIFQGPLTKPLLATDRAELPTIGEGEILGRVKAATICGSDLHTFLGKRNELYPR